MSSSKVDRGRIGGSAATAQRRGLGSLGEQTVPTPDAGQETPTWTETQPIASVQPAQGVPTASEQLSAPVRAVVRRAAAEEAPERVQHNYNWLAQTSDRFMDYYQDWSTRARRIKRLGGQPSENAFVQALVLYALDQVSSDPEQADRLEQYIPDDSRRKRKRRTRGRPQSSNAVRGM